MRGATRRRPVRGGAARGSRAAGCGSPQADAGRAPTRVRGSPASGAAGLPGGRGHGLSLHWQWARTPDSQKRAPRGAEGTPLPQARAGRPRSVGLAQPRPLRRHRLPRAPEEWRWTRVPPSLEPSRHHVTSLMVTGHCEPGDRPDLPPPPPPRVNSWDPPGKVAAQRAGSTTTGTWRALKAALPVLTLPFWGARPFPGLRQGSLVPPRRPPLGCSWLDRVSCQSS